jgi:hypothetical protein
VHATTATPPDRTPVPCAPTTGRPTALATGQTCVELGPVPGLYS